MFKQISAFVPPASPHSLLRACFSLSYLFALRIKATFMARNSLLLNEMRLWINKYTPTHTYTHRKSGAATRTYTDLLCETNHSYAALETFCVCFMRAWLRDRACMRVCVFVWTRVCVWRTWSDCQGFSREIRLFLVEQQRLKMSCLLELQFLTPRVKSKRNRKQQKNTQKKKLSCRLQLYHTSQSHAPVLTAHTPKTGEKKKKNQTGKKYPQQKENNTKMFIWFKRWQQSSLPLPPLPPVILPPSNFLSHSFALLVRSLSTGPEGQHFACLCFSFSRLHPSLYRVGSACSTNLCRLSLGWAGLNFHSVATLILIIRPASPTNNTHARIHTQLELVAVGCCCRTVSIDSPRAMFRGKWKGKGCGVGNHSGKRQKFLVKFVACPKVFSSGSLWLAPKCWPADRDRERESGGVTETAAYCGDTSVLLTRTDAYTQTHRDTGREIDRQKDRQTEIQTVS